MRLLFSISEMSFMNEDCRALRMCNVDGSLMAFICNAMPDAMRETLYDRLKASFDNLDIFQSQLPSSTNQRDDRFETVHFSWWNRYGVSVNVQLSRHADKLTGGYRVKELLETFIRTSLRTKLQRAPTNSTSPRHCLISRKKHLTMNNSTLIFRHCWLMFLSGSILW